jgi:hypothetical protein
MYGGDFTISDDEIVSGAERLRVSWESLVVVVLEEIGSRNDEDDIKHEVEVGVGDAGAQDQAS